MLVLQVILRDLLKAREKEVIHPVKIIKTVSKEYPVRAVSVKTRLVIC